MKKPAVISFIAPAGGLGRSKALLQVGGRLARQGHRVAAVDADFVSPVLQRYAAGDEGGIGLADWLQTGTGHLPLTQSQSGLWLLSAGRPEAIHAQLATRRPGAKQVAALMTELAAVHFDYVLLDLPPGHLLTGWKWAQTLLQQSLVVVPFAAAPLQLSAFVQDMAQRGRGGSLSNLCPVVALHRQEDGAGARPLELGGPLPAYAVFIPRISALESPSALEWKVESYLTAYEALTSTLIATVDAALRPRLEISTVQATARAFAESVDPKPEILTAKVQEHLGPRSFVIMGRHGAGKSALIRLLHEQHQSVQVDPQRFLVPDFQWESLLPQGEKSRLLVIDSPEDRLAGTEELQTLLKKAGAASAGGLLIKVLLRPATVRRAGSLLQRRDYTALRWTGRELLELALRRAVNRSAELAGLLHARIPVTPTGELGPDVLPLDTDAAARLLFGPFGPVAWQHFTESLWDSTSEFIPSEASQLLYFAIESARLAGHAASYLSDPSVLTRAAQQFFAWKVARLPAACRSVLDDMARQRGSAVPDDGRHDEFAIATLLDHGFLVLDDSTGNRRLLRIPPRLFLYVNARSGDTVAPVETPPEWNTRVAPIPVPPQPGGGRDERATEALRLLEQGTTAHLSGRFQEASDFYERALALFGLANDQRGRALVMLNLGRLLLRGGQPMQADGMLQRALAIYNTLGDVLGSAETLLCLAELEGFRSNLLKACTVVGEALALYTAQHAQPGRAGALHLYGKILAGLDKLDEAMSRYNEALALYRSLGIQDGVAGVLGNQGGLLVRQGDLDLAAARYGEAMGLFTALGDKLGQANILQGQGELLGRRGSLEEAFDKYSAALALHMEMGNQAGQVNVLLYQGTLLIRQNLLGAAAAKLEQSLHLANEIRYSLGQANALAELGRVEALRRNQAAATAHLSQALSFYRSMGNQNGIANTLKGLGEAALEQGDLSTAEALLAQAYEHYTVTVDWYGRADTLVLQAMVLRARGLITQATAKCAEALGVFRDLGDRRHQAKTLWLLGQLLARAGRLTEAETHFSEALSLYSTLHPPANQMDALALEAKQILQQARAKQGP